MRVPPRAFVSFELFRGSFVLSGGDDKPITEALVVSFRVIMGKVFANGSPQRILTEEKHALQAFLLDRPQESFGKSVQVGRARRKLHGLDS